MHPFTLAASSLSALKLPRIRMHYVCIVHSVIINTELTSCTKCFCFLQMPEGEKYVELDLLGYAGVGTDTYCLSVTS